MKDLFGRVWPFISEWAKTLLAAPNQAAAQAIIGTGGGGGGTIESTTDVLIGDGTGNAVSSGVAGSDIAQTVGGANGNLALFNTTPNFLDDSGINATSMSIAMALANSALQPDGDISALTGGLTNGVVAVTQAPGTNSTLVATTEYADAAAAAVGTVANSAVQISGGDVSLTVGVNADTQADTALQIAIALITGSFNGVGTATTTFTVSPPGFPGVQARVNVTPTNLLAAAAFYVTNKTGTSFDVVYLAGLTGTVTFDWACYPNS